MIAIDPHQSPLKAFDDWDWLGLDYCNDKLGKRTLVLYLSFYFASDALYHRIDTHIQVNLKTRFFE